MCSHHGGTVMDCMSRTSIADQLADLWYMLGVDDGSHETRVWARDLQNGLKRPLQLRRILMMLRD
jgi:hypothetical protein